MLLPFALWTPLIILAVMILVPVHAVDTTTRVGVFLAGMFAEMDIHETMPALSWAGVAIRLGLGTVGDLLDALDRAVSEWAEFTSEATLISVGVPLAAVATVNVVLLIKLRALSSNPVLVVLNPNPNALLVNDTDAPEPAVALRHLNQAPEPAPKRVRTARQRVTRDDVTAKVRGMSSPFGIEDYRLLLNDTRITLSDRGTKKVLQLRAFEHRAHIANMLQLDLATVESVPSAAERTAGEDDDPLECAICGSADASDENPMLKCDGDHELEVYQHASSPPPLATCTKLEPVTGAHPLLLHTGGLPHEVPAARGADGGDPGERLVLPNMPGEEHMAG